MELTIDQAREVARLRRRHPSAQVVLHHRERDLIMELRRGRRTVALERFAAEAATCSPRSTAR